MPDFAKAATGSSFDRRNILKGSAALIGVGALGGWPNEASSAETIKIGVITPLSGVGAESGQNQRNGINQAVDQINAKGGVLGRAIEVVVADDQTTNPGAVLAFSQLASRGDIAAFIGSVRSTQMQAISPDVKKVARPVMFGGTAPSVTQSGNPWLFRCRPSDIYSAKVIASYGVEVLGKKKWAIVYSTDAFGSGGNDALVAELGKLGVKPVLDQGYANQQIDFTPIALAIRQSDADILGSYFNFETDNAKFARQRLQLGIDLPWIGSQSIVNYSTLKLAGPALFGTFGVADYAVDASAASKAYADEYQKRYNQIPDNQSSWAFDAVNLLALAMTDARSTDPERVRSAMLAIRGCEGAEGQYNFTPNGDGLHGNNLVQNVDGKVTFVKHIEG
jgi:branched-chain amino acid transport system substrate-binding protein